MLTKFPPVILIDDDEDDCDLSQSALRAIGVKNEIICFDNGKKALQYFQTNPGKAALVICDINMPVMSGFELKKD